MERGGGMASKTDKATSSSACQCECEWMVAGKWVSVVCVYTCGCGEVRGQKSEFEGANTRFDKNGQERRLRTHLE